MDLFTVLLGAGETFQVSPQVAYSSAVIHNEARRHRRRPLDWTAQRPFSCILLHPFTPEGYLTEKSWCFGASDVRTSLLGSGLLFFPQIKGHTTKKKTKKLFFLPVPSSPFYSSLSYFSFCLCYVQVIILGKTGILNIMTMMTMIHSYLHPGIFFPLSTPSWTLEQKNSESLVTNFGNLSCPSLYICPLPKAFALGKQSLVNSAGPSVASFFKLSRQHRVFPLWLASVSE